MWICKDCNKMMESRADNCPKCYSKNLEEYEFRSGRFVPAGNQTNHKQSTSFSNGSHLLNEKELNHDGIVFEFKKSGTIRFLETVYKIAIAILFLGALFIIDDEFVRFKREPGEFLIIAAFIAFYFLLIYFINKLVFDAAYDLQVTRQTNEQLLKVNAQILKELQKQNSTK